MCPICAPRDGSHQLYPVPLMSSLMRPQPSKIRGTGYCRALPADPFRRSGLGLVDTDDACVQPLAWEVGKELYGHPDVNPDAFLNEYQRAGGPVCGDVASLSIFGRLGTMSAIMWMTEYADGVNVTRDAPAKIRVLAHSL